MTARKARTVDERRAQLRAMPAKEIRDILAKCNPWGRYRTRDIERHKDLYIESVIQWEGWDAWA